MRRLHSLALPLLAASLLLMPSLARADQYDDDHDSHDEHRQKPELGIAVEAFRSSAGIASGAAVHGAYIGMHGRFGRRVALGFGLEQAYGDDPSGWRRFDIGWNLPKLYVYLNPSSKTQLYATTGFDMRVSHFDDAPGKPLPGGTPWGFMYFGTFLGGGVEHRLDKTMVVRIEVRTFVRGRVSGQAPGKMPPDPELSDETRGARGAVLSLGLVFF